MKTILLAYDDTRSGEVALERAAEIAGALGAKLVVASVAPMLLSVGRSGGTIDPADSPARHEAALQHARSRLWERGLTPECVCATGDPADTIVRVAKACHADLIVVGLRSTNPVKRLLGQNVSESVLHKAGCAVLVARAPKLGADAGAGAKSQIHRGAGTERERLAA